MEDDSSSVFKLITNLCEKFYRHPSDVKNARTRCYEILLGKRLPKYKKVFKDLNGIDDAVCNSLAWQFQLTHEYDLRDHALKLQSCIEQVQTLYGSNIDDFNNILKFLLSLRNIPKKNENKLDLSSLPVIEEYESFNSLFRLPTSVLNDLKVSEKACDEIVFSELNLHKIPSLGASEFFNTKQCEGFSDEGYCSPPKSPNIWELVSKLKYSNRKNWESYGYSEPDKEPLFLSELGDLSSLWVENLESLYLVKLFKDGTIFNSNMIPRKIFIRDIKYLLVGLASESFNFDDKGQFYLVPGITVEGITPDTLSTYCHDLVYCGTCNKALNRMSTPNPESGKYKYDGYIFKEFCESINRYLKFYQTAIFSIPESVNYLQFHENTYQLQLQICTLASICKVGPGVKSEEMPHGVSLLNYFYQKVLSVTEEKLITVLYSILYPCCQVYFSRFLKQWILEGMIDDPYGEFFIKPDSKFIVSRGRTYWTRSYTLREDMVPDFLTDLKMDVLQCGKSMNLLKFCQNSSKLCLYLMGKKPPVISCCLTLDQLTNLRLIATTYYLEVCAKCGPRFKWNNVLKKDQSNPVLLRLIAEKRTVTLRRIELERERIMEEEREKRNEEISSLREQYIIALEQKQLKIAREIEEEMRQIEEQFELELRRQQLIQKEANEMIDYYMELFKVADSKKSQIETHIKKINSVQLEHNIIADKEYKSVTEVNENSKEETQERKSENVSMNKSTEKNDEILYEIDENLGNKSNSSGDSFYSVVEDELPKDKKLVENPSITIMHSSKSMDLINANATENLKDTSDKNANVNVIEPNIQQALKNFETARKIKEKVMFQELGIEYTPTIKTTPVCKPNIEYLTQAQKNKLRVLSSEFGIELKPESVKVNQLSNAAFKNRNRVLGTSACFEMKKLDNESFLNKNVKTIEEVPSKVPIIKKSQSLMLDFDKTKSKQRRDSDKPIPMSVDSTPISEFPQSPATTPSTMFMSVDTNQIESVPSTADTQQIAEEFNFNLKKITLPVYLNSENSILPQMVFSKRMSQKEVSGISTNCLKLFLHQSLQIPLITQTHLVNDDLLKFFINDLEYLKHLNYLRDFFFLQDGEFTRTITDNLFAKLYDANFPTELINCRTLQDLVFGALDISSKRQENSACLSFKINNLPKCFDLGDPNVLDCLSLTYKVKWPLNILLPTSTISKYDEIFKFLLKLNRMSWVLKKIFLELKVLAKETGKKEIYLMSSPQYRKLHQCRHIMTHIIQTLQNYVVGEVLQSSWELFEKNLMTVTSLDELYYAHTSYIKNILFMCLLNQKTQALRNVIHKIFVVILKFFDYLRSRSWICEDGSYVHPNFKKLESIFENFQELVLYFFRVARKVAKSGYQPHLFQLLDTLDINNYISNLLQTPR